MPAYKKVLGTFQIVMINVIAVDSIRTLPFSAGLGFSLVFFYLFAALLFFIPSGLISAELGTGWPSTGGIYIWVREAFGRKTSLAVIWLNWIYNIVWYPTIMALIAGIFTYFFNPELITNKYYMMASTLTLFWTATIVNLFGMKVSSIISTIGALLGTIFPMVFISILGIIWWMKGEPLQIDCSWSTCFPDLTQISNLPFLSTILFGLLGLEMAATHAAVMKNPKRDYPRAVFYSMFIILGTIVLSSLAIAFVVPNSELNLITGVLQAFVIFFNQFNMPWMVPIIAGCIILGGLGGVSAWVIGPTKGMMVASVDGNLPHFLAKKTSKGVPVGMLLTQGSIVTLLSLAFIFMPTIHSSFWLLSQMTAQLALIVYVSLFAAGIRLRYKDNQMPRSFRIPGGKKWGMWIIASAGIFASLIAFLLGFIPPPETGLSIMSYELILIGGIFLMLLLPYILRKITRSETLR